MGVIARGEATAAPPSARSAGVVVRDAAPRIARPAAQCAWCVLSEGVSSSSESELEWDLETGTCTRVSTRDAMPSLDINSYLSRSQPPTPTLPTAPEPSWQPAAGARRISFEIEEACGSLETAVEAELQEPDDQGGCVSKADSASSAHEASVQEAPGQSGVPSPSGPPLPRADSTLSRGTVAGVAAHCGYHVLAFCAHWFGAARFDANGDGEFDPTDVQRMMNGLSRHLRLSFSRPTPRRRQLKARADREQRRQTRQEKQRQLLQIGHQQNVQSIERGRGSAPLASTLQLQQERVRYGLESSLQVAQAIAAAPVQGECKEVTVRENLRQFLPWFTIAQACVCAGLWLGYALQSNSYAQVAFNADFDQAHVIEEFGVADKHSCEVRCSSAGDTCAGFAFRDGPAAQCKLLSALPSDTAANAGCGGDSWNWSLFEKQGLNLVTAMAGLESAYPGQTLLKGFGFCDESFPTSVYWRLLSYQFSHGGLLHILPNCVMLVILGVPLEGFHGTGLIAIMFSVGVLGGGLNWMLIDPYRQAMGLSGGCFGLLGIHFADLAANWRQTKFRYPTLLLLLGVGLFDLGMYVVSSPDLGSEPGKAVVGAANAHSVHAGGLVSGLLVGMLLNRNMAGRCCGRALRTFALLLGAGALALCAWWWHSSPLPAVRSLWYLDEQPLCWIGQVCTNDDNTGCDLNSAVQCVACSTRECVENWYMDEHVFCVVRGSYETCGGDITDLSQNCHNC